MNTRKSLHTLTLCAAAVAVAAAFTFSDSTAARASRAAGEGEPRGLVNATAPVSIADGQTLRVNFLNAGRSPFEIIPCVFDAEGSHLKTWDAVTLLPGQTLSFELNRAEAGRRGDGSVRVRAGVHCDGSVRKYLVTSGEVAEDATGRTSLFLPGLRVGFDPQPDPPVAR